MKWICVQITQIVFMDLRRLSDRVVVYNLNDLYKISAAVIYRAWSWYHACDRVRKHMAL